MNEYDNNFEFPVIDDGTELDWISPFQPQEPPTPAIPEPAQYQSQVAAFWPLELAVVWWSATALTLICPSGICDTPLFPICGQSITPVMN